MKQLQVIVKDKNTLILLEDGKKDDQINLAELANVDLTAIEEVITSGRDQVYQKKLAELRLTLEQERKDALAIQKLELTKDHSELVQKLEEQVSNYDVNKALEIEKINAAHNLEVEQLKAKIEQTDKTHNLEVEALRVKMKKDYEYELNVIERNLRTLEATLDQKVENERLIVEQKYAEEISELKRKLAELVSANEVAMIKKDSEHEEEISKLRLEHSEEINKKNEIINQKDMLYQELQNRKATLNVKMIGEGLEAWCHNEMTSYMQNGFLNCKWIKDNKVVKTEEETSGTKADFIFNIYASEACNENELLAGVCLEMKDENPNSTHKKKNTSYLETLHKNRVKKGCKYAILVSNLELDNPNDLPILKVREYDDMYVVRPAYMVVLLNMITSLTTNFKDLLLEAKREALDIKSKTDLLEEFEALKKTYLEKELEILKTRIEKIRDKSSSIIEAAQDIEKLCLEIFNGYVSKIQTKLEKFEVKINKEYRKFEKA